MTGIDAWSEPFCPPGVCHPNPCKCLSAARKTKYWPIEFSGTGNSKSIEKLSEAAQAIDAALEEYESIRLDLQRTYDPNYPYPAFDFEDFQIKVLFDAGPNPLHTSPEDCPPWAFHLTCNNPGCGAVWHLANKNVSNLPFFKYADPGWVGLFLNLLNRISAITPGPSDLGPKTVYFC